MRFSFVNSREQGFMVYVVSFGHRDGNCLRPRRCPRYRILKRVLGGRVKLVRMRAHDADGKPETMTNPTDPGDGRIRESSKSPGSSPSRLLALALTHTRKYKHTNTHKQMRTRRHTQKHTAPLSCSVACSPLARKLIMILGGESGSCHPAKLGEH